jgi:heptosyltransferase-2
MKIVLFCPNWVGDAVMATPAIRAIRCRFPTAEIHGLMLRAIAETLAGNPWIDNDIVLDELSRHRRQRGWQAARRLRKERFDLAILFPGSFGSALTAWMGRAKRRIGYDRELRGFLLTDALPAGWTIAGYPPSPVIDYYLRLAEHLGGDVSSRRMELFVNPGDAARADELLSRLTFTNADSGALVLLNPGSAFGPAKRWPVESFAELSRRLVDHDRARVLVLCGPAERELARAIASGSERGQRVASLAEEDVSIGFTKALVQRSSLLVTTDSGPRHFAPAFGVPVVSLFGPTHIRWTDTYYEGEIKLQHKLPCGPCQQRVCPEGHHRCMKELGVDEVHAAARQALTFGNVESTAA